MASARPDRDSILGWTLAWLELSPGRNGVCESFQRVDLGVTAGLAAASRGDELPGRWHGSAAGRRAPRPRVGTVRPAVGAREGPRERQPDGPSALSQSVWGQQPGDELPGLGWRPSDPRREPGKAPKNASPNGRIGDEAPVTRSSGPGNEPQALAQAARPAAGAQEGPQATGRLGQSLSLRAQIGVNTRPLRYSAPKRSDFR